MPTPLGHALVGLTISWSAQAMANVPARRQAGTSLAFFAGLFAIAPDFDFVYPPIHRTMTHSIAAAIAATICAAVVAHRTKQEHPWVMAAVCGLAYASHLALDWLGGDTKWPAGIQLLWPFSDEWFISSWNLFTPTVLETFFEWRTMVSNFAGVVRELVILSPFVVAARLWHMWRAKRTGRST